ncbi:hypothetical protein [Streptomyces californicus]|uniref:hypothetical protein n=1 Tax=Streptomyces californicus TaxID=67351 RepID=UPI0037A03F72
MRHVPVFRWLLAIGLALTAYSAVLFARAPDLPALEQVELSVLEEKPDGTCVVSYANPFVFDDVREGPYRCDPRRDWWLKGPEHSTDPGNGQDIGWVLAEGPDRGELFSRTEYDRQSERADTMVAAGLSLVALGVVGGNVRSLRRARGVRPRLLRRAARLKDAAELVAEDHRRAVEAVRTAWAPLHRELVDGELGRVPVDRLRVAAEQRLHARELEQGGIRTVQDVLDAGAWTLAHFLGMERDMAEQTVTAARRTAEEVSRDVAVRFDTSRPEPRTTALLAALRVLVDAGPDAHRTARAGKELAALLKPLLVIAEPATGVRAMLRTSPREHDHAIAATYDLRLILAEAERAGLAERFGQTSVDLLRGPDATSDAGELATWADFEARPARYYEMLAATVEEETPDGEATPPMAAPRRPRRPRHPRRTRANGSRRHG